MKNLSILVFFLISSYCSAQIGLEQALMVYKSIDNSKLPIEKRIEFLEWTGKHKELLDTCTSGRSVMIKAHKIASILFVLDQPKDSVINYLEIAKKAAPFRTCRMLIDLEKEYGNSDNIFLAREYFGKEVSIEWWTNFVTECYSKYDSLELQIIRKNSLDSIQETVENESYANVLAEIYKKDQAFRDYKVGETFEKEKQWKLDTINRLQLDSLYNLYGFPSIKKVGKSGFNTAWFVLQHSPNCEWNKKWMEIYIKEYQKNGTFQGLILATMTRFFNPKTGYCDKKISQEFIKNLEKKYSLEVAEKFGYKDYFINDNKKHK